MNPEIFFTKGRVVLLMALGSCFLWGSAFPAVKYGYQLFHIIPGDVFSQLLFAGYRFALAGLLVLIFAALSGRKLLMERQSDWGRIMWMSLGNTVLQYVFFYTGLANTSALKGSILNPSSTFFSVILAHFIYKDDRLNRYTISGCFIGFLGVVVVNWGGGLLDWSFKWNGEGFLLLASLSWAAAGVYGKIISQSIDPIVMTGWQIFLGGLILTLAALLGGGSLDGFTLASGSLLAYLAFLSAASFVIYTLLLKYNPVSRISIFNLSIPVFGATLSAFFLGEKLLEWKNLLALILVCLGIWLVTAQNRRIVR